MKITFCLVHSRKLCCLTACSVFILQTAHAAVDYSAADTTYSENFNNAAMTTTPAVNTVFTFTNDSTVVGWYSNTAVITRMNSGTLTDGQYSVGDTTTDGSLAKAGSPAVTWGLQLFNNTGQTLTEFTLSYTGELWRETSAAAAQTTALSWAVFSAGTNQLAAGGYTAAPDLDYTFEDRSDNFRALPSTVVSTSISGTVTGIDWQAGQYLWLVWNAPSMVSREIAIDDISFSATAIPEASTTALLAGVGALLYMVMRRKRLGSLTGIC